MKLNARLISDKIMINIKMDKSINNWKIYLKNEYNSIYRGDYKTQFKISSFRRYWKAKSSLQTERGGFEPGFSRGMKYQALYLSDVQVFVYCPELKWKSEPVLDVTRHTAFLLASTFLYILSRNSTIVWWLFPTNSYSTRHKC